MNPITQAITSALSSGVLIQGPPALREAYHALKTTLHRAFIECTDIPAVLELLESQPESPARQAVFEETLAACGAAGHPDLLNLAQLLLDATHLAARPASKPCQHPRRLEPFINRVDMLARLETALQPGQVVQLTGPEGCGKSALAVEAARRLFPDQSYPAHFPDGLIFYDFFDAPRTDLALERIVCAFADIPKPTPYDAAERVLTRRQALLVFDHADHADDLPGLLTCCGQCGVLIIGQNRVSLSGTDVTLPPLPPAEAVALLQEWGGWHSRDPAAAADICQGLDHNPLALRLAGQHMAAREQSAADFLAWLRPALSVPRQPAAMPPLLLAHSLAHLSQTAREVLAVTGLLAYAPVNPAILISMFSAQASQSGLAAIKTFFRRKPVTTPPDVTGAIRELVKYGFLVQGEGGIQLSHPAVYNYTRRHVLAPAQAIRHLAAHYVDLAWECNGLGPQGDARLEVERPHIMKILAGCLEWEDWGAAHGLAVAVEEFLDRAGFWADRVRANEIGLIASWQLGRASEGAWLGNLGDTYRLMGHPRWAIEHFEKALITARQTGNLPGQGNALGNLGLAYRDLGQLDQATSYLRQALPIFEKTRSPSAAMVRKWLRELDRGDRG